jgi:hypothetical protein
METYLERKSNRRSSIFVNNVWFNHPGFTVLSHDLGMIDGVNLKLLYSIQRYLHHNEIIEARTASLRHFLGLVCTCGPRPLLSRFRGSGIRERRDLRVILHCCTVLSLQGPCLAISLRLNALLVPLGKAEARKISTYATYVFGIQNDVRQYAFL